MVKKENIVVTAALPYANGDIHIGHLLEYIQADIFARFLKLQGKNALYICASDMHGTPIEINAQKAGIPPEKFVEKYWHEQQDDFAQFLISFDNFYKTHSLENRELSELFFTTLKKDGFIYRKKIKVVYCPTCKRSLPDRFVKGKCPTCNAPDQYGDVCEKCSSVLKGIDLLDPYCTICNSTPIEKESEHYFFKLGAFSSELRKWSETAGFQPEVQHWLREWFDKGLEDWCISRDGPYFGFPIPNSKQETGEEKFFYVWLDAPIGYISSTKNHTDKLSKKWEQYWKKGSIYHFIGKDIAYFHFLFWPAMLLGMGIPLPQVTVHGFITVDGQKMSKSRGTFFTARDFAKLYPAEALRFYYASHLDKKVIDVDLQFTEFAAVTNNVLAGNIGNFCYRVLTFAEKNYGQVKEIATEEKLQKEILNLVNETEKSYTALDFKSAVKSMLKIADVGNAYFQQAEPWKNKDSQQTRAVVGLCVNIARILGIMVSPILPKFSAKINAALGEQKMCWKDIYLDWKGKISPVELLVTKVEIVEPKKFPLQLMIGEITAVKDHPQADKLYVLQVNLASLGKRQVVAGLRNDFTPAQLLNQKAVFCVNLKPAVLRGEKSEAMILVADDGKCVSLLQQNNAKPGDMVAVDGFTSSSKEVTFEEFKKLVITIQQEHVFFGGKKFLVNGKEIKTKNITDNTRIQ